MRTLNRELYTLETYDLKIGYGIKIEYGKNLGKRDSEVEASVGISENFEVHL